ncbi:hypothetical protein ACMX2H_11470 [Arthrobacter sulfonylureivorans]|uniref:hypothetical protein n=1 Tax=Arthrobacter sulfonylureivorans TaxID=2486855 RepID=UPI0039E332DF
MTLIAAATPAETFIAYSEDAEEFWASFGWTRHEHRTDPDHFRPAYVGGIPAAG